MWYNMCVHGLVSIAKYSLDLIIVIIGNILRGEFGLVWGEVELFGGEASPVPPPPPPPPPHPPPLR